MSRKNQNEKQARKQAQAGRRQQRIAGSSSESKTDTKRVLVFAFSGEDESVKRIFAYYPGEEVACIYPVKGNLGVAYANVPYETGRLIWTLLCKDPDHADETATAFAKLAAGIAIPIVYGDINGKGYLMYPGGKPMQAPPVRIESLEHRDYLCGDPSTVLYFPDSMNRLIEIHPHADFVLMYPDVDISIVHQHEFEFRDDLGGAIDHYFSGTKVVRGFLARTDDLTLVCYEDGGILSLDATIEELAAAA